MTYEEACGLKVGDRVEVHRRLKGTPVTDWYKAHVKGSHHITFDDGATCVVLCVEMERHTPAGNRRIFDRYIYQDHICQSLRLSPDPVEANVFADWLDEHNHPEAATALRTAFPISDHQEKV